MDKRVAAAQANSSYTFFYLLSAIGATFVFSDSFGELRGRSWFALLGFALLIYFVSDFIKQLYSPGQSLILFVFTFSVVPCVLSILLGSAIPLAGVLIWVISMIAAGVLELIYEYMFKSIAPKRIIRRLLLVDGRIDKSLVNLNTKYESSFSVKSFVITLLLISIYCVVTLILIPGI